jgi:uncharacterized protein YcfL
MRRSFPTLTTGAVAVLLAIGLSTAPLAASVADKVEALGVPTFLKVDTIRMTRRNDFLVVQAEILNTDHKTQSLTYRFKWLDSAGFTVGGEETWKSVIIYGKQKKLLDTMAPVQQATDFRLELHAADNEGKSNTSNSSNDK